MVDPGDARFACALFDALRREEGNLFFSAASVRIVLAMVYEGARGRTADEMRSALGFGTPAETSAASARALRALSAVEPLPPNLPDFLRADAEGRRIVLRLAGRVWAAKGCELLEAFTRVASEAYGAPVERLDFAGDTEGSRRHVNAWVEDATEHKVVDLVAPGQVGPDAKLVVTNAAYFKARWSLPFLEHLTRQAPFHAPAGEVTARLMEQTAHHLYAELPGVQLAELPYGSGEMAMRVATPRDPAGLAAIEPRAEELLAAPLQFAKLHVLLPRFRVESRFQVERALADLGMPSLFRYPDADLSGIDGTRELFVSGVIHQAFVETDENGTEAAAATALIAPAGGMPRPEPVIEMRVDRPFLLWIVHRPTNLVLFSGRVVRPS